MSDPIGQFSIGKAGTPLTGPSAGDGQVGDRPSAEKFRAGDRRLWSQSGYVVTPYTRLWEYGFV